MLLALALIFASAAMAPALTRWLGVRAGGVLGLVPLGLLVWLITRIVRNPATTMAHEVHPWVPSLGVELSFVLDGWSAVFALLVTGIGALILPYASRYAKDDPQLGRLLSLLTAFMGAMLGLVLADDLISLYVFWELTSITSFLLIGHEHDRERAREAALQALLVTTAGGLALLVGAIWLGNVAGYYRIEDLVGQAEVIRASGAYGPIFALVVFGAFTKSAQVPFHFWLPNAMEAPTPVSAYLHSATMVKAGVYLLGRLEPVLGGTAAWLWTLSLVGMVTMLMAAVLALRQTDIKRILAYTTVSVLGMLVLLLGLGFDKGAIALVVYLVVHALYKGALFLIAGVVDHEAGTLDIRKVSGLGRVMPWTAATAVVGAASMAGLPPMFGFVGKELSYEAKLGFGPADVLLPAVAVVANGCMVTAAGLVALRPFFGSHRAPKRPHEASFGMRLGPMVLVAGGLLFGVAPALVEPLVEAAAAAVLGRFVHADLALWHGLNVSLLLSGVTVAIGVVLYWRIDPLRALMARTDPLRKWGPEQAYGRILQGVRDGASVVSAALQTERLREYLFRILATLVLLLAFGWSLGGWRLELGDPTAALHSWGIAGLLVAGAAVAVTTRSRSTAVLSLGVVGFLLALLFLLLGAPDLAMTQLLVETLIVVIVVQLLRGLPSLAGASTEPRRRRFRDASLAGAVGIAVAGLVLTVGSLPFSEEVARYYAEQAEPEGHGRNVVNVILVDFRALDTLGEILVLGVAALGAGALLRLRNRRSVGARED